MIHIIKKEAMPTEMEEMLEALSSYIKLAVDIKRKVIAGGGMLHADCKAALLNDGSKQGDVWGADWLPDSKEVRFGSLINIRPRQNNRSMVIENKDTCRLIERIVKEKLK